MVKQISKVVSIMIDTDSFALRGNDIFSFEG